MSGRDEDFEALVAFWVRNRGVSSGELARCMETMTRLAGRVPAEQLQRWRDSPLRHGEALRAALDEVQAAETAALPATPRDLILAGPVSHRPQPSTPPPAAMPSVASVSTRPESAQQQPASSTGLPAATNPRPPAARGAEAGLRQEIHGDVGVNAGKVLGGMKVQLSGSAFPGASRASRAAPAAAMVRILFLGANPLDSTRLRLDEEVREIDRVLAAAAAGRRFELCQKWAVRAAELQGHLLRTRPHVVHFSGHGSRESAIFLEDEDGHSRSVPAQRLARLLAQFNHRLRCVVLNACYSEEQGMAIAEHIDCVIGMSTAVIDHAAIRFAAAFYQAIVFGCSVQDAYQQACADLNLPDAQDDVPRLIALRCDPSTVVFAEKWALRSGKLAG